MRVNTVSKTSRKTTTNTEEHAIVQPAPAGSAARQTQLERLAFRARLAAIGLLALFILIFAAFQYAGRDNVRTGVHAFGVDLSGMTEDDARIALTEAVQERGREPLVLTDGNRTWELSAAELGLTMDIDAALADAMDEGRSGIGPSRMALLWRLRNEPTEVALDQIAIKGDLLNSELAQLQADISQPKIDPVLTLDISAGPTYVPAQIGRELDVETTRAAILGALASGQDEIALSINETEPIAWDEDYAAVRQRLDYIWNAPIEIVAAGEVWTWSSSDISNWLTLTPAAGQGKPATLAINEVWIDDVINLIALDTNSSPQSARVWWDVSGTLIKTADGNPGKRVQWDEARAQIHATFTGENDSNRVDLPVTITDPPALPENLASLGIVSNIGEASTAYGGGLPERMHNIELAASRLNGVLIMPGQTFSFNGEVGPTTVEAGFQIAYGIANEGGELTTIPSEAGGICQVATTVFQPVFWGGYAINERATHSYWIPNYASNGYVGLDAAVDEVTGLDFKWTNNTSTAILLEAEADGQYFTVRLYGTSPPWSVEVDEPVRENIEEADEEIVYQASDTIPDGTTRKIEGAQDGFDVSVTRRVIQNGETRSEVFSTSYGPSRNVVLVGSSNGELPAEYR